MLVYIFHQVMTYFSVFLLFCAILSKTSSVGDYYVKLLLLYISYIMTSTLLIPHGLLHYKTPWKTSRLSADLMAPVGSLLGIQLEVKGIENIDKSKAYVIVANHQSSLDVLATSEVWKHFDRAAMVAKKELQYLGTFGLGIKLCGTVFVDRASSEVGRAAVNEAGKKAKQNGTSLWIFPEGTRHHGSDMLPFKKGAFHVALNVGLPVLPVVISEYDFLDHKKKIFGKGKISIRILPPISTEGMDASKESLNALIETTRGKMLEAQKDLQSEATEVGNKKSN